MWYEPVGVQMSRPTIIASTIRQSNSGGSFLIHTTKMLLYLHISQHNNCINHGKNHSAMIRDSWDVKNTPSTIWNLKGKKKSIPAHREDLYVQLLTAKQRIELENFPPVEVQGLKRKKKKVIITNLIACVCIRAHRHISKQNNHRVHGDSRCWVHIDNAWGKTKKKKKGKKRKATGKSTVGDPPHLGNCSCSVNIMARG